MMHLPTLVQEYKMNTPLFMLANKYKCSIPELVNILHKFTVEDKLNESNNR